MRIPFTFFISSVSCFLMGLFFSLSRFYPKFRSSFQQPYLPEGSLAGRGLSVTLICLVLWYVIPKVTSVNHKHGLYITLGTILYILGLALIFPWFLYIQIGKF
jgi:hypothetical protein